MFLPTFDEPDWLLGMNLAERLAGLPGARPQAAPETGRTARRLESWRLSAAFPNAEDFTTRLSVEGVAEADLRFLLGETPGELAARTPVRPAWLDELASAYSTRQASADRHWDGFLALAGPLLTRAEQRITAGIQDLSQSFPYAFAEPQALSQLVGSFMNDQLLEMLNRTLVLELNVCRLQGLLQGDTPEGRFNSFIERMWQADTALALLREYPVLARLMVTNIEYWVTTSLELLERLCLDWQEIRQVFFSGEDPGSLAMLMTSVAGDIHRRGRSVAVLQFHSGARLVYKPRSLTLDLHFQELLEWLNARGARPGFQTLKVLSRDRYGWVENVWKRGCTDPGQVQRFYERQGGYLALLYALEASDMHCENLIASGENPFVIDLETLFQPRFPAAELLTEEQQSAASLQDSVLRTGLLPWNSWGLVQPGDLDFSGLGSADFKQTRIGVLTLEGAGTDQARLVRKPIVLGARAHRPKLNGKSAEAADYIEEIAAGFERTYRLILDHRSELLSPGGPLEPFAGDEVRMVLRETNTYRRLLQEGYHPDVLRDALDRDRLFDNLWVGTAMNPTMARVIPAERADLWNNDVPYFALKANSRDLLCYTGVCAPDFFSISGLEAVRSRLEKMDIADMEQQLTVIRQALEHSGSKAVA